MRMKLWLLLEMQWAISWAASGAEPLAVDGEAGVFRTVTWTRHAVRRKYM